MKPHPTSGPSAPEPPPALAQNRPEPVSHEPARTSGPDPYLALEAADQLRSQPGSEQAVARYLDRAGLGFAARYQWQDVVRVFTESLDLCLTFGSPQTDIADRRFQLAKAALNHIARYDEAVELLEMARAGYRNVGNRLGAANCILCLGDVALRRSDLTGARTFFQTAQVLYEKIGNVLGQANSFHRLGDIAFRHSDYDNSFPSFATAHALYVIVGDLQGQANCIRARGNVALAR